MMPFPALPITLATLLLASSVFAGPISPNDPFRAIALRVPREPEPPVCCLKPLSQLEPVEDEILLSFEEWKAKQSALQAQTEANARDRERDVTNRSGHNFNGESVSGNESDAIVVSTNSSPSSSLSPSDAKTGLLPFEAVSPHFRVPLTDRFNYANLDCSARVHLSHRSAKSASSILSSKRDRYMLSPCSSKKEHQFVVVELCEDVRIDTVQLANFEFFSGVFKDFTVSVAKTYSTDVEGWITAGTYRAKNVRGVQSFHPPTSLRDFYRYIRIDFHSHYGNEFYCPISLLRVYGLTHLEQWKWDIWEAESRHKQAELEKARYPAHVEISSGGSRSPLPASIAAPEPVDKLHISTTPKSEQNGSAPSSGVSVTESSSILQIPSVIASSSSIPPPSHVIAPATQPGVQPIVKAVTTTSSSNGLNDQPDVAPNLTHSTDTFVPTSFTNPTSSHSGSTSETQWSSSGSEDSGTAKSLEIVSHTTDALNSHSSAVVRSSPPAAVSGSTPSIIVTSDSPSFVTVSIPPVMPAPTGGESIYRTIMNRLTAIENNHTLYSQYIEQQNSAIRDVIKRLGEDVGRLEGISRGKDATYQRTIHEWEKQQTQLHMEYSELISRVDLLSEEIILEKRLGIAQLFLLLAVLVFMGLTRGSRGEPFMEHAPVRLNKSMREWGKRHLSSDWASRLKAKITDKSRSRSRSRSQSRTRGSSPISRPEPYSSKSFPQPSTRSSAQVEFPSKNPIKKPLEPLPLNNASGTNLRDRTFSGPRTPTSRSRRGNHLHLHIQTPSRSSGRPAALQRSNSQGTGSTQMANAPRSPKKWARTAHLHEVRTLHALGPRTRKVDEASALTTGRERRERVDENEDVFMMRSAPLQGFELNGRRSQVSQKVKETEKSSDQIMKVDEVEVDLWVDTDSVSDMDPRDLLDVDGIDFS